MLKQFKHKKRPGRKLNGSLNKKETIPDKKEEIKVDSSDSDFSDSDDSEYEEILISSIKKNKKPDVKPEVKKEELQPQPLKLERQETKPDVKPDVKKEELLPLEPLKLERQETKPKQKKKSKPKNVIIKKYYQQKPKTPATPALQPVSQTVDKLNYLGLPMRGDYTTDSTRKQMTHRIFQW